MRLQAFSQLFFIGRQGSDRAGWRRRAAAASRQPSHRAACRPIATQWDAIWYLRLFGASHYLGLQKKGAEVNHQPRRPHHVIKLSI